MVVVQKNKDYFYIVRIFSELNLSFNVKYIKLNCTDPEIFVNNLSLVLYKTCGFWGQFVISLR